MDSILRNIAGNRVRRVVGLVPADSQVASMRVQQQLQLHFHTREIKHNESHLWYRDDGDMVVIHTGRI